MRLQELITENRAMLMAPGELGDQQRKAFNATGICRSSAQEEASTLVKIAVNLSIAITAAAIAFVPLARII